MPPSIPAHHPRVIVADNHEWILQILTHVVRDTLPTAEIVAVEDGRQALEQCQQGGCTFLERILIN